MLLFDFNDSTIERFTEGDCWVLALELAKTLVPVGWKIGWSESHAFVVSPCYRFYLDIYGVQLLNDFYSVWLEGIDEITEDLDMARKEFSEWTRWPLRRKDCLSTKLTAEIILGHKYFDRYMNRAA